MFVRIDDVLAPEQVAEIRRGLEAASFVDGKATAGWNARLVKNNEQTAPDQARVEEFRQAILDALRRNPLVQSAALPFRISAPMISRYAAGMAYGDHVDDPVMPGNPPLRSDISFTLFLSDPESYEGGALVMETSAGRQGFRLEAGSAILYSSNMLHCVEPVTAGVRLAAVGWMQSLVREPAKREILFDLDATRRDIFGRSGKTGNFDALSKTYANLVRMWAEL